ncbi:hypothetical protein M3Y98_00073400 [Aphelenchoides besseyi]|nr:hypothetical protein M3Y98_00073400 [Aphelenchoides besseyi]KAI6198732.1 hypothetical protein M3Y96_00550600 [Aphelenchoides besseyi]
MRSLTLLSIFVLVCFTNSMESKAYRFHHSHGYRSHWLCHPCKELFKQVKKEVGHAAKLEENQLQQIVNKACKELQIGLLEKVCRKIGKEELDKLYDLIVNKDKVIDPDHACKAIHLCK